MKTAILIPARYASTRFPGKPLTKLGGKTMIERVYEKCKQTGIDTYVLTDSMQIFGIFGSDVCWIDQADFSNGTERCAHAIGNDFFSAYDQFINVQGDMPDVTTDMILRVEEIIAQSGVATAYTDLKTRDLQFDSNTVKMVHNDVYAHWFGRGIAWGSQHLGIYGYSKQRLLAYANSKPDTYEELEGLEQLRWLSLQLGTKIAVRKVEFDGIEINTPEDAEKWNKIHA
ncbi:hypothetical protein N9Q27_00675 [bacterium]|jgi:3-deoxy-manno-octulosonate cytidylyltransferase (CMP-KDO synthetase)|nr:hypothetical protein [bacterium]